MAIEYMYRMQHSLAIVIFDPQKSTRGYSGAGKNLKVRGHMSGAAKFLCAPPLFGSTSTISRLGERFRDGQYSLVSFLIADLLTVLPCLAICKI